VNRNHPTRSDLAGELAEASGVPIGTLRGWEYGRRTPLIDAALRVAEALGVSLDELAGRDEPPPAKKTKKN
jgi:transcriptional regulator with XRE-family HTH domain